MIKVSVIIPVYCAEPFIERCARSLFEQTLDDMEFLFINDCSPDRSEEILRLVLEEYPQRKEQVVIHRMDLNSGQAKVREWGMKNATGEYVIHCDADDWVDTSAYEKLYDTAEKTNADIVVCGFYLSDGVNKQAYVDNIHEKVSNSRMISRLFEMKSSPAVWNKLIRRDLYERESFVFPTKNMGEDLAITTQLFLNSTTISFVNEPLYYYYMNNNSTVFQPGRDKILKRFDDAITNTNIAINKVIESSGIKISEASIDALKFHERNLIVGLIQEKDIKKQWLSTYHEINIRILFNRRITFKEKVRYCLNLLR